MKSRQLFYIVVLYGLLSFGGVLSVVRSSFAQKAAPYDAWSKGLKGAGLEQETGSVRNKVQDEDSKDTSEEDSDEEVLQELLFNIKNPFIAAFPKKRKIEVIPAISGSGDQNIYNIDGTQADVFDYSSLWVAGLIWGGDKPKVILNGEIYGIGDVVNGATIKRIDAQGILFEYNEQEYLLKRI